MKHVAEPARFWAQRIVTLFSIEHMRSARPRACDNLRSMLVGRTIGVAHLLLLALGLEALVHPALAWLDDGTEVRNVVRAGACAGADDHRDDTSAQACI